MKESEIDALFEGVDDFDDMENPEDSENTFDPKTIEFNPQFGDIFSNIVETKNLICDTGGINMPPVLGKTVQTIKKFRPTIPRKHIINMVMAKTSQMLTAKRIKYVENGSIGYPNYYAIIFMPSGTGKDRLSKELDKIVFYPFRIWFKYAVERAKMQRKIDLEVEAQNKFPEKEQYSQREKFVKEGMKEFRNLVIEVSEGTREGLYADAKAFKQANFGSLMIKMSELGQYIKNMKGDDVLFFNNLFDGYDGTIHSKCTKSGIREEDITDIPVNALLYSDPTLFKGDLEKIFEMLMKSGLNRRCHTTFTGEQQFCELEPDAEKAYKTEQKYYSDLKALGLELIEIFEQIKPNSQYELTRETYVKVLYPYRFKLAQLARNEDNTLIQQEIISRELKAIKTAADFASLNHPTELVINPEDMEMAIDTEEILSEDFRNFVTFRPAYDDKYDRIFNFFLENFGIEFKKSDLVTKHCKTFRISREKFRKSFDDDINVVSEIAVSKGYQLLSKEINNNSGKAYWLTNADPEPLSDGAVGLEDLI